MTNNIDFYKQQVGITAAGLIEPGMAIGLGTGSTARFLIQALAQRLQDGLSIIGAVPTSQETAHLANQLGIPLISLDSHPTLDLAIDGADEIDPQLNLIKGAGGALLREKVVASAAQRFVIIGDSSKLVSYLGTHAALPIEIIPFALTPIKRRLETLGAEVKPRMQGEQFFVTDNQNYILDCSFANGINDPHALQQQIDTIVGVVEHGLFLHMADQAIVAGENGLSTLS